MQLIRRTIFAILLLFPVGSASSRESIEFEITAGAHDRENTPVFISLPESMRGAKSLSLTPIGAKAPIAVQLLPADPPQAVWILREPLLAGAKRRYRLETTEAIHNANPAVTCADNGETLLMSVSRMPVLSYQTAVKEPPPDIDPVYRRSGYLHPVFSPSGLIITDDFAPDEPHQHGMFNAWVNTTVDGRNVNFWDPKARTGRVEHSKVESIRQGDILAEFEVQLTHTDITTPKAPQTVFQEIWNVRTYNLTHCFLVDFESIQTCEGDPCTVNKHYYGGMAFRGRRDWFDDQSVSMATSEGRNQRDGNESRPAWVSMSGPVPSESGRKTSLANLLVLGHPENFRAPQSVRLHPDKPYFCFAPEIEGSFTIAAKKPFVSRYRFLIFDGETDSGAVQRRWNDYAEPPTVRVLTSDEH